ncbi:glutamine-dependent NAD(+) synthetase [Gordonia polyisoprenivorans NBRC 16320 = JCM 10675]|uniref:Carbon-nitrogen hydrolase family protein n=1 Tax=Gordonia polyisoprenivorans TaxID=84595 RepID=A0A846WT64_9ACTN|nr:carbon-nitrogen hydrolase family protein [Gordonia polyisoprenivorans]NKY04888.1 carbon-nitrogen hydrolase family protein [Gordonia polyisoprenivorans]GAB24516.1 glutamine-dependent NAD(+) synthetase [Gordonia polyisoprenivorans NBRC 16320 = JCM 10675]
MAVDGSVLRVAVAQPGDGSSLRDSARRHAGLIRRAGADLIVFPELSLTGYHLDARDVAVDATELGVIADACHDSGCTALIGAPISENGQRYIAVLRIDSTTTSVVYRKCFPGADERPHFAAGPGPCAITVQGWSIGLGICRDTGVAAHVADTAALDIDLYACGVVHHRWELDEQRRRAARIAEACRSPVAMASAAGRTGGGYDLPAAHSAIVTSAGEIAADAGTAVDAVVACDLQLRRALGPAVMREPYPPRPTQRPGVRQRDTP